MFVQLRRTALETAAAAAGGWMDLHADDARAAAGARREREKERERGGVR